MRRRTKFLLSAACGTLATLLAVGHADAVRAEVESERSEMLERYGGEVTSLVVAREGLSAGELVGESDVEVREWLADLAPDGALTSLDSVVGQRLVSAVAAGSPLAEVNFASGASSLQVPEGRVAVTVRVSEKTGVSTDVAPGTRLLAYGIAKGGNALISADALVLGGAAEAAQAVASSSSARELTVAVDPDEVMGILSASASGGLRLVVPADDVDGEGAEAGAAGALDDAGATDEAAPTDVPAEDGATTSGAEGSANTVPAQDASTSDAEPVADARAEDASAVPAPTLDAEVTTQGGA